MLDTIEFDSEFFGPERAGHRWVGKVVTIFRDSTGAQWCAFECVGEPGWLLMHGFPAHRLLTLMH